MYKIIFKESPNKWTGRSGYTPIAIVNHRMVGYLSGTDVHFSKTTSGVSAHFGIGYRKSGEPVEITQYVDLADTAWSNGVYDSSGGWTLVKKTPTGTVVNPNYYTISIEHEDGGPNDGRVTDEVKEASSWLQSILLSGDIQLMRHVGIQVRTSALSILKTVPITTETIIDHNKIAGKKKPYCWQPYKMDTGGFPAWQPELITQLRGSRMAISDTLDLLDSQVEDLVAGKAAAEAEADAAKLQAQLAQKKLVAAKSSASVIATEANKILEL